MSHLHFCLTRSYCAPLEKLPTDEAKGNANCLWRREEMQFLSPQRHSSPPQGGRGMMSASCGRGSSGSRRGEEGRSSAATRLEREPAEEAVLRLSSFPRPHAPVVAPEAGRGAGRRGEAGREEVSLASASRAELPSATVEPPCAVELPRAAVRHRAPRAEQGAGHHAAFSRHKAASRCRQPLPSARSLAADLARPE
jgi:hypothetical protein